MYHHPLFRPNIIAALYMVYFLLGSVIAFWLSALMGSTHPPAVFAIPAACQGWDLQMKAAALRRVSLVFLVFGVLVFLSPLLRIGKRFIHQKIFGIAVTGGGGGGGGPHLSSSSRSRLGVEHYYRSVHPRQFMSVGSSASALTPPTSYYLRRVIPKERLTLLGYTRKGSDNSESEDEDEQENAARVILGGDLFGSGREHTAATLMGSSSSASTTTTGLSSAVQVDAEDAIELRQRPPPPPLTTTNSSTSSSRRSPPSNGSGAVASSGGNGAGSLSLPPRRLNALFNGGGTSGTRE